MESCLIQLSTHRRNPLYDISNRIYYTRGPQSWPVRNQAAQQEVSGRQVSEASSVFTAAPHRSHYCLSSASCQHYGELYNYFITYYNVIIIEIKCTINVFESSRNHPSSQGCGKTVFHKTGPWCQKRLGTAVLDYLLSGNPCFPSQLFFRWF